jgi:hypothetical protein
MGDKPFVPCCIDFAEQMGLQPLAGGISLYGPGGGCWVLQHLVFCPWCRSRLSVPEELSTTQEKGGPGGPPEGGE